MAPTLSALQSVPYTAIVCSRFMNDVGEYPMIGPGLQACTHLSWCRLPKKETTYCHLLLYLNQEKKASLHLDPQASLKI